MDADGPGPGGGSPLTGIRRACDQCRLRKIRCDKESPCSNCKSAKRSCSSTGLGQKPKEPRQRVLISAQYENKIDDMQDRLAGIEKLLLNLTATPGLGTASSCSIPNASPEQVNPGIVIRAAAKNKNKEQPTPSSSGRDDSSTVLDPEDNETFEGNSSLAAHAAFASELVSQAIKTNSLAGPFSTPNPRMEAALSSLRQMVDLQISKRTTAGGEEGRWPTPKHTTSGTGTGRAPRLRDLPMPPMDLVVEKLRDLKSGPGPMMLMVITCFMDVDKFVERCRRVYFCTDDSDLSEGLFIIVNAGLVYLFFETAIAAAPGSAEKARLENCGAMCQSNVDVALSHLPLLMPATLENIEALLMAASFAIDLSRPSLAWLLVSRAANMCRTLGLHQESSVRNDSPQLKADKALLFWSTYMLDKGLSLRLGRASVLQDYDISVLNVLASTHGSQPSQAILSLWIKHAEVQGKIYQRLYSPGALRQSEDGRSQQVRLVVKDLQFLLRETLKLLDDVQMGDQGKENRMFGIILKSDEVSYYSSLALAYRALPPSGTGTSRTFADECLEAAQAAMRSHEETMAMLDETSLQIVYLHWTILYAPFIPFIVIFCHVIETSSSEGLPTLEKFVRSLQNSCEISAAVDKLYQLSRMLYNVALLYVEAKTQQSEDQDMIPVGNEFDMYLSQLGFMPPDETLVGSVGTATIGDDVTRSVLQTAQLGDWFSGGNLIMGLIEEDLSTFNTVW